MPLLVRAPLDAVQPSRDAWDALLHAGALLDPLLRACLVGAGLTLAAVVAVALYAVLSPPQRVPERRWLLGAGLLPPAFALAGFVAYAGVLDQRSRAAGADGVGDALRIELEARQWWWEVRYRSAEGRPVPTANEIRVPVGRTVVLALTAGDVMHRMWLPALGRKADMIPGRVNELRFSVGAPGVLRGQCAQYCGTQHALMAFQVVAEDAADFTAWLQRQAAPAMPPTDPLLRRGRDVFLRAGCGGCHTVRGTEATGQVGPDLTHVGSRHTLAAGTLRNHAGALAEWIAHSQRIKPGSLMPSQTQLAESELDALAAYVESLR
jgi:cytochrome c oxidase subunit 2